MDKFTAGVGLVQKIEKQARQLAYDTRYKVKQSMKAAPGSKLDPASVTKSYLAQLAKSSATPAVKARAKQMLMGNTKTVKEEVMGELSAKDMATDAVANALYKVFVEKKEVNIEEQAEELKEFYSKINKKGERLYHIIVTDKKTGNTYTRDATREKIAELRANPNIASVEMSERRLDSEKEKSRGAHTASVKAGKGLDPVGKEDGDIDNDGDKDKTDEYLLNRRKVRGAAISKRKGVAEEFLIDANDEKQIKPMPKGATNNIVINPELPGSKNMNGRLQVAHYDMQGNPLSESEVKFLEMLQEKKMGKKEKVKEKNLKKKYDPSGMKQSMKKQYGEKKGEEVYFATIRKQAMKEASECENDDAARMNLKKDPSMDPRSIPTEVSLAKIGARYRGAKNPIVMVATEQVKKGTDYLGRDAGGSPEEHDSNVRFGKAMANLQGAINPKPGSLSKGLIKPAN